LYETFAIWVKFKKSKPFLDLLAQYSGQNIANFAKKNTNSKES
jgi:hypothetical protein